MAAKKPRVRKPANQRKLSPGRPGRNNPISGGAGKITSSAAGVFRRIGSFLAIEYHPIKLPQNKFGRFLTKRRSFIPGFISGAFKEIQQTTWPGARETIRLTYAVFVFALIFSVVVAGLDFVLDKIFKALILG